MFVRLIRIEMALEQYQSLQSEFENGPREERQLYYRNVVFFTFNPIQHIKTTRNTKHNPNQWDISPLRIL